MPGLMPAGDEASYFDYLPAGVNGGDNIAVSQILVWLITALFLRSEQLLDFLMGGEPSGR